MNTVGKIIRYYRKQKGISQEAMAHDLDITTLSYSKIERDKIDITLSRLVQIAKYHKISIVDLIPVDEIRKPLLHEIAELKKALANKDKEIIGLQKEVISLQSKKLQKKK